MVLVEEVVLVGVVVLVREAFLTRCGVETLHVVGDGLTGALSWASPDQVVGVGLSIVMEVGVGLVVGVGLGHAMVAALTVFFQYSCWHVGPMAGDLRPALRPLAK